MSVFASIIMENEDVLKLELFPEKAPITVANFCDLANRGFYDNLSFHRVVKDFVIQGGSEKNDCRFVNNFKIDGECYLNGVDTGLTHERGAISMARLEDYDSADTQFFIVHQTIERLDGRYSVFGKLVEGYDVLDKIASVETAPAEQDSKPLVEQTIKTITIEADEVLPEVKRNTRD
ncbi:MAG: peptidylprolyl isomerase [bacterium]